MTNATTNAAQHSTSVSHLTHRPPTAAHEASNPQLKEKFDQFVGETFYGQMLKSMHKMTGKPAYFHGGRAEEAFQGQLDQVLSEKMTQASAGSFTGPMYDLFTLQRSA